MKKLIFLMVLSAGCLQYSEAGIVPGKPLSDRQTGYSIKATLDPVAKEVSGDMTAFWVNRSTDVVKDVELHMYLNAFRSRKSTFLRESGSSADYEDSDLGRIDIKAIHDKNGTDLLPFMHFISPDDGNKDDMTVLEITLPEAAQPGDTVNLKILFESRLPGKIIRTGYSGDYFFVAQWFPKFGVYEPAGMRYAIKGGWNCHQFHRHSEFYSNHSVYNVDITLPEKYVVGTGGLLLKEKDSGNGIKTLTYRAEDIVDFAWTAWPGFAVNEDHWKNVKITLLSPPERRDQVQRQFQSVKDAFEYFDEKVGPYPWPYLTIVDPPTLGAGSGGMEYTTLFTSESYYAIPAFLHFPEMVTIHEFGHAYFMGILASNEFEEPWLDEGVNTFWEGRIVDHYYGKTTGIINNEWLQLSDQSLSRLSYVTSPDRQASSNSEFAWNYPHGTYGMMSYSKTAVILSTLMGIVGKETMDDIFRQYYREWAFRHPSGRDFINVVNEVVTKEYGDKFGTSMNWFFDETIYGTGICDYKVSGFHNIKLTRDDTEADKNDSLTRLLVRSGSLFKSVAELERTGDITLPEEVLFHFDNGEEVRELWDGKSRFKDFTYIGKRKILWVKIDPGYKIPLDVNYINNSMTADPDRVPVRRLTDKLLSVIQYFINFVSL